MEPTSFPLGEWKNRYQQLTQLLTELSQQTTDPKMRSQIDQMMAGFRESEPAFVDAIKKGEAEVEAMKAQSAARFAQIEADCQKLNAMKEMPTPSSGLELKDTAFGLELRDSLLHRYVKPKAAPTAAAKEVGKDVWQDLTAHEEKVSRSEKDASKKTMSVRKPVWDADVAVDDDEVAEKPSEKEKPLRKPSDPAPPSTPPKKPQSRPNTHKDIGNSIFEVEE